MLWWRVLAAVVVGAAVLAMGLADLSPVVVLAAVAVGVAALVLLRWPDLCVPLVAFLLYINAPVVAMRFHGAPRLLVFAVPALLLLPLGQRLLFRREGVVLNRVFALMLVLLAVHALSALQSMDPPNSLDSVVIYLQEGVLLYVLLLNVVRTPTMLRAVAWSLLAAGLFLGVLSVHQQVTGNFDNDYWGFAQVSNAAFYTGEETLLAGEETQPRLGGPLGDQNRHAQNMLLVATLGIFIVWSERSLGLRLLAAGATAFTALSAALTFSRGAAVAFVAVLLVMALLRYIKVTQVVLVLLGVVLLMRALPEYGTRLGSMSQLGNVLSEDTEGIQAADSAAKSRTTEMLAAALVTADHPLLGVGPGMFRFHYPEYADEVGIKIHPGARESHNLFLGVAADLGLIGLSVFIAIILVTLWELHRERRRWIRSRPGLAYLVGGYLLMVVAYLASGMFLHMAYERYFWIPVAMAAAAAIISAETAQRDAGATAGSPAEGGLSPGASPGAETPPERPRTTPDPPGGSAARPRRRTVRRGSAGKGPAGGAPDAPSSASGPSSASPSASGSTVAPA